MYYPLTAFTIKMKYAGDNRHYSRYKIGNRYFVKCCESIEKDGKTLYCNFVDKREDRFKENVKKGKLHECNFILKKESDTTILQYFTPPKKEECKNIFDDDDCIKNQLVYLLAKKNISIDAGASDEFYQFICFCTSYGIHIATGEPYDVVLPKGNNAYHHYRSTALATALATTSKELDKAMIKEFSKLEYTCVAIDEGKTAGVKNLDFILENPLSNLHPYPAVTEMMESEDAAGYVTHLLNGLASLSRYNINISSIVCDGNKAQKKAFSFEWPSSLRNLDNYKWIQKIYYIPCLCHRINCAYKYTVEHDKNLFAYVQNIRDL